MESGKQLKIKEKLPKTKAILRACVAAIPTVGGALDHLIFDQADSIKIENLQLCFDALSERMSQIEDNLIDKDWFASEEALAAMKVLNDKISYEPNKEKVKIMGEVTAILGLNENSKDKQKIQRLEYIGDLSYSQIELLKIIDSLLPIQKEINTGGLKYKANGKWTQDIVKNIQKEKPHLLTTYMEDMEILESRNTIRKLPIFTSALPDHCYTLTNIGKMAAKYLCQAE